MLPTSFRARRRNRPQPRELAQLAHRREVFLHSAAVAIFIRRIQIGDEVPLTQILCELGLLVEQSGKRERLSGFRILQRFKWDPTARVYIGIFSCRGGRCAFRADGRTDNSERYDPKKQ